MSGLTQVGPRFVGFDNFRAILNADLLQYTENTLIMWLIGFVPQIILSLLLAVWFTDLRLRLRATSLFKTVIYMPNLIMAAAFSMLFFALFSDGGPVNNILVEMGILQEPFRFMTSVWATRGLVAGMNFLMWFGNTTILLMAAIMGIDSALFEAAAIDGATSWKIFTKITIPTIRPIMLYVWITSMIGGIQMFDVPQILTNGKGTPDRSTMTLIMYLNNHLFSKNYGMAGALSVVLFIFTSILSIAVFVVMTKSMSQKKGGK
jgi:multiple sugar transport system permease protein